MPGPIMDHTPSFLHDLGQPGIVSAMIALGAAKILPAVSVGVLVAVLTILIAAAVLFVAVADSRRKAETVIVELTNQFNERKRAAEQMSQRVAQLEVLVAELTAQLEAANKESEAFSYTVGHDLRAPLRHISGFSKILRDTYSASLDTTAQDYLRFVCDGAKNMGRLIDDLLAMGRIGRQELVPRPTDLNLLVGGAVANLQQEYEGREIDWKIGELPSIECDSTLVKQVFANLLSNAVKYTRLREKASIEVGRVTTDGAPTIFVRDNGTGFDQRYAHKLFGVFQRLHSAEEYEGTGIGLATAQRIVLKHGGRIWAEAEVDKGATFFFTLAAGCRGSANGAKSTAAGES
ncbi:MAG TPA: ATP-binding protein [Acidobacteriaceae bacterium]|nr:ATP-binding protein [Acidobacteriaceae bacterium]